MFLRFGMCLQKFLTVSVIQYNEATSYQSYKRGHSHFYLIARSMQYDYKATKFII